MENYLYVSGLKMAVEDLKKSECDVCENDPRICSIADTCYFKWQHSDEAMKLIGGEE